MEVVGQKRSTTIVYLAPPEGYCPREIGHLYFSHAQVFG